MDSVINEEFLIRLLINFVATLLLVRLCFHFHSTSRAYAASSLLFGMAVFMVTGLLHSADISMGFAFGLFAVFSMLRYRTEQISIREMTYLFLIITIALLTAVAPLKPQEIALVDGVICLLAYLSETGLFLPLYEEHKITYGNLENIKPDRYDELLLDLREQTGFDVAKATVHEINLIKKTSQVTVFFKPQSKRIS